MTLMGGQTVIQPNWDIYGCCIGFLNALAIPIISRCCPFTKWRVLISLKAVWCFGYSGVPEVSEDIVRSPRESPI